MGPLSDSKGPGATVQLLLELSFLVDTMLNERTELFAGDGVVVFGRRLMFGSSR